ncbi:hypothetical protein TOPH_03452 [Tolypocladium ophioglossoides CBS 100239]|uniref:Uncharacterized protein n=1 Tax=Tolypocladium ophioglossoides (strain CBS 100239) TaxID=1163406 RepID=A0A0L0NDW3_TOLOC|nr:hypothetical protein TOPH_03452 [Tolypocladium ophioglossoides CBS 100239]
MPLANLPNDDEASLDSTSTSVRKDNNNGHYDDNDHHHNAPTTPTRPSPGATPKSAPVAAGARPRSNFKKPEPTLLTDFLLGRPSHARIVADRKHRRSVEAVKAELRQEMKQSSVRKLQPPGGVRDRVSAWQRANATSMAKGDLDDAATEPTDVAFKDDDEESVTEEDRVRIKMRQKKRSTSRTKPVLHNPAAAAAPMQPGGDTANDSQPKSPPKKRVVSDDNWRKPQGRRNSPRRPSPRANKSVSPNRIPSDFVLRSAPSPNVSHKIKEWAAKVEVPDTAPPRSSWSSNSRAKSSRSGGAVSDAGDTSSQVTARHAPKSRTGHDDGIRVTPSQKKPDDNGTRVRPTSESFQRQKSGADMSRDSRPRSKTISGSGQEKSLSDRIEVVEEPSGLSRTTGSHRVGNSDRIEVVEDPESVLDTPTKRPGSRRRPSGKARPKMFHPGTSKLSDDPSSHGEGSNLSSVYHQGSDLASSIANKSLADIPGDIPFGHSAFSELDLSLNKSRPKRTKVERNTSLKSMPNVFKKVVEEGKKIIHDMNEPPRQHMANNPPSIEKWLNNTVDPFVDDTTKASTTPKQQTAEKKMPEEPKMRRRSSHETRTLRHSAPNADDTENQENKAPPHESTETTTPQTVKEAKSPPSAGLKRSRATRSSSSPLKSGGRRPFPFLGVLKEAFQGESSGHMTQPKSYQSQEQRKFDHYDDMSESYHSSDYTSTTGLTDASPPADDDREEQTTPKMAGPRYRPPTNGKHELSTILSEDDSSAVSSDLTSDVTQSTVTQSTVLTRDSEPGKPHSHAPGLKRRLTRHSDLVSVLSLPDNSNIPSGIKNNRSRPSLRKTRGTSDDVTAEELLREFVDDGNLYLRELKTLVDGVVPVLLSHVINGTSATELFSYGSSGFGLSKSVVNMGVALEKLKNAHRKAPTSDIRRLANWAHGVVPFYNSYLSAWRLGFEDVVVNLAPAAGGLDDEDSLLNALPRNEGGDIVNAEGQRVAVSHLLKRPLIRVKQMTKFVKCVDAIIDSNDTHDLLRDFESLQDNARQRHKEESARMMDEDAINTDTARARDLRTFDTAESVSIDPSRQVNAKDAFSLALAHSNGQRLECQVELVHRDNQNYPDDRGDLLIREIGGGRKSYLLFSPLSMSMVSARAGDGDFDMVIMVRGMHNGKAWHELLTLVADNEDQILDWLDILPLSPVPPKEPEPSVVGRPGHDHTPTKGVSDTPTGAQIPLPESPRSPIAKDLSAASPEPKRPVSSRYRPQRASMPMLPLVASPERTPTEQGRSGEAKSRPLSESMRPDPRSLCKESLNSTPYRGDGAPPPPVHRTLSSSPSPQAGDKSIPSLQPPTESQSSERIKRRGSSPLKHEYLPSDVSSGSETYSTEVSDAESSDDEIESVDIPETELGVSIKTKVPRVIESLVSESECSLTPSNSASQAGMHGHKTALEENAERFMASISRWSDKGTWKDVSGPPCSIIVTAGLIEAFAFRNGNGKNNDKPLVALDLTPLVLIRQSTALDLEIRSSVQPHSRLYQAHSGGNFRFRCSNAPESFGLYMSVHHARLNNQKFIQLENEARFKSFGERKAAENDEGSSSSRRRSWFGRKNSYRSSVRAPSQSHDGGSTTPSSTPSASSFLKRLTVAGNLSFNIARSSVDRQSMGSGGNSLYTSGSSSASGTPPRSPSVSVENSSRDATNLGTENIRIRLHLLVAAAKWEDYGNCSLQIRRPPPGWRQALRADHGLEKRVTATTLPKKDSEKPRIVLDAVLGSGCFSPMGSRGIVCGVWEEVKNGDGVVGMVPATGATGGMIKKWCFQFSNAVEAAWVLRLVHQEVVRA